MSNEKMNEQEAQVLAAAAVFKQALAILNSRSKKYGDPNDVFQNFRVAADISDTEVTQGIMTRFGDKVGRIRAGLRHTRGEGEGETFTDESLKDSIIDGINYLAILFIWLETGGGEDFLPLLEENGMVPSRQPPLPGVDYDTVPANAPAEHKSWFQKYIKQ